MVGVCEVENISDFAADDDEEESDDDTDEDNEDDADDKEKRFEDRSAEICCNRGLYG